MRRVAWIAFLLAFTGASSAGETWLPLKIVFSSGTQVSLTGNVAYDVNRFGGEFDHPDAEGVRRKEFGIAAKRKDYFDAGAQYEFESRTWMDVYVRAHSKGLLGTDIGSVRVGWIKTPVGLEGLTASRAPSFLEAPCRRRPSTPDAGPASSIRSAARTTSSRWRTTAATTRRASTKAGCGAGGPCGRRAPRRATSGISAHRTRANGPRAGGRD